MTGSATRRNLARRYPYCHSGPNLCAPICRERRRKVCRPESAEAIETCISSTRGRPCKSKAIAGLQYCWHHSPLDPNSEWTYCAHPHYAYLRPSPRLSEQLSVSDSLLLSSRVHPPRLRRPLSRYMEQGPQVQRAMSQGPKRAAVCQSPSDARNRGEGGRCVHDGSSGGSNGWWRRWVDGIALMSPVPKPAMGTPLDYVCTRRHLPSWA